MDLSRTEFGEVAKMKHAKEDGTRMLVSDDHLAVSRLKMHEMGRRRDCVTARMLDREQCIRFLLVRPSSG